MTLEINHVLNRDGGDSPYLGQPCEVVPEASFPCGYGGSVVSGKYENSLFFGDNLDVLREMPGESVDLVYLDPPFNSNADYNVLYGTKRGGPSEAQSHAFVDTWTWGRDAQRALNETADRHLEAGALLDSFQRVFPESNMMAYLAMMAVRLIEMRRVLKSTGSLYLHCDPTASHYLKILLDAIFGPSQFLNEIIWKRAHAHNSAKRYGPIHDVLLFYGKSDKYIWNDIRLPYSEEYKARFFKFDDDDGRGPYSRGSFFKTGHCENETRPLGVKTGQYQPSEKNILRT
jgi:DNA modification methylase